MFDGDKGAVSSGGNGADIRKRVGQAAKVFDRHGDEIRAIIDFNVQDDSSADDIFQDFFVSVVNKPIPPDIEDIRAYLYRAVTNDVVDICRQAKIRRDSIQRYAECRKSRLVQENPQSVAIRAEETERIYQLIESRLAGREAKAVIQRYGRDLSTTDTAEQMCVHKRSVARYLTAAIRKIRSFVSGNEDDIE
ncbi:MAG: RNA polymerase sigma factor [Planctomycetota bacterium]|jgi:RNA polymerase sigma factor (sigma-70 family)